MAEIRIADGRLRVAFTPFEKVAGLLRDLDVPLSSVREADVVDDGFDAVRGLRAPGLGLPGVTRIGTWRGAGRRALVVVRRGRPALVLGLRGQRYDQVVVTAADAASLRDRLPAAAR